MIHNLNFHQKTSLLDVLVHYMQEDISSVSGKARWENFFKEIKPLGLSGFKGDIIAFWMDSQSAKAKNTGAKLRLLHPVEKEIISTEAYGYMVELARIGILTPPLFEDMINQCMMQTSLPVTRPQIKSIVANVLSQIFSDLEIQSSH